MSMRQCGRSRSGRLNQPKAINHRGTRAVLLWVFCECGAWTRFGPVDLCDEIGLLGWVEPDSPCRDGARPLPDDMLGGPRPQENGSASGRERVCQDGKSVG